jgi:hypothetical protein
MGGLKRKDILGLREMDRAEIDLILDTADTLKDIATRPIKKVPTLRGKSFVTLFYENSTRTAKSFELAGKYLSADAINISISSSSVQKGETLIDTARNLEVMGVDAVVGMAVQNGVPVPNGNKGDAAEKHYVGMQRVREYVAAMPVNREFTVHDVFAKSIEHMSSTPKTRHPEFEKQRKASISLALTSMAKAGDLEIAKQGRGRETTVYRRPEGK